MSPLPLPLSTAAHSWSFPSHFYPTLPLWWTHCSPGGDFTARQLVAVGLAVACVRPSRVWECHLCDPFPCTALCLGSCPLPAGKIPPPSLLERDYTLCPPPSSLLSPTPPGLNFHHVSRNVHVEFNVNKQVGYTLTVSTLPFNKYKSKVKVKAISIWMNLKAEPVCHIQQHDLIAQSDIQ